jgi:hypothetical protein
MGKGRARFYNLISIILLILAIAWIVFVISQMLAPPPVVEAPVVFVPTAALLPTSTDTFTPTFTLTYTLTYTATFTLTPSLTPSITPSVPPSATPITPTLTFTPTRTFTNTPSPTPITPTITESITPSLTITSTIAPTLTPIVTDTPIPPTLTATRDFTPQPTPPPPSPFPFDLKDNQIIFTQNFANAAGCAWQGLGGQVFDVNGQPLTGIRVHVFGNGIDQFTASGTNTLYGASGWEIPLGNTVSLNSYIVELQTPQGTIISPQVTVSFPADCTRNLALVNFQQNRPF